MRNAPPGSRQGRCALSFTAAGVRSLAAAKRGLVVEVDVPDSVELVRDPADPSDFVIRRGIPPGWITRCYRFDATLFLEEADIERYGRLAALARNVEGSWNESRLAAG
jgi:hypothetical protein